MKRALYLFLLTLTLAFALRPSAPGASGPELKRLGDGIYGFIGVDGATNSGVVVTDEGVVVIDTQGPKGLAMALRQSLEGVTDSPVIFVVNTHYHGDHTFGNQYFTGPRAIIAHDNARKALVENDAAHRARFKRFFGETSLAGFSLTLPGVTFSSSLSLRVGSRTFVIVHPGIAHTEGDVYVYLPEEKVVFTGDLLFKGRLPWLGDGDSLGAVAALDELLALDATVYVPGHGPVAGREDLRAYKGYLLDLRREVKRLKYAGKTLNEVKKEIRLDGYADLLMYDKWLPLNAGKVYLELGD
jgi:cyclase